MMLAQFTGTSRPMSRSDVIRHALPVRFVTDVMSMLGRTSDAPSVKPVLLR